MDADQGAKVTLHGNTNLRPIKDLKDERPNDPVHLVMADLSKEDEVEKIWAWSELTFGPVQVVVVNHGIWPKQDVPLADMTLEQWNGTIQANLTSSFVVCREYLRGLKEAEDNLKEKAAIILIGSTAGKYGEANHADYAASKSGSYDQFTTGYFSTFTDNISAMMYGLTLTLKNEIIKIAPKGRVNCVAPGWVNTPMAKEALKDPEVVYGALAT